MNRITGELLHLELEQLAGCRTFAEAAADFIKWCGADSVFCTWGSQDLLELQRNMDYYHMTHMSETPIRYYDIQKLFGIAFEERKSRRTLEYAVDFLRLEKTDAFHRADADARYAAQIFTRINRPEVLRYYSYDTYRLPGNRAEELHILFDDYGKYISRAFPDKTAAMADNEVRSVRCPLCGGRTKKKVGWFANNAKHYYAVVYCARHGLLRGKIRVRKSEDNRIYVVKTIKQIDSAGLEDVLMKKRHRRELRRRRRHGASS